MPPPYAKGHVRSPIKDHLLALKARRHQAIFGRLLALPAPPVWDSRAKKWVVPVVNQAQCGSCWDFSGTGMVDTAYCVAGIFPADGSMKLSEQYTLDCGKNGGCNGDDNVTVLEWAKSTGLPTTKDYGAYEGRSDRCAFKQSETLYKIDDWGFCDPNAQNGVASTDSIKAAIMQYGCVGAGVAAGGDSFWDSGTGVGTGRSSQIDHDVIIVGWDDSKGSGGAWLMRNSWGTSWGDKCANAANPSPAEAGYAWVQYGAYDLGSEAVWCVVHSANPPIDWGTVTP